MADKTAAEGQQTEKEPDFSDVEFEGEDNSHLSQGGQAGGEGAADQDERLGEREGVSVEGEGRPGETEDDKRARRKQERQQKKERVRAEREELRALRQDNARLVRAVEDLTGKVETRFATVDATAIDNRLRDLQNAYANAKARRAKAMTEGNSAEFDAADEQMANARLEYDRLADQKRALASSGDGGERRHAGKEVQAEQQINPRVSRHVNTFLSEFPDYDPDGRDRNSRLVQMIDAEITEEGFDPTSREYWEELADRVREQIPEWADGGGERANGHANGGSNGRRSPLNGGRPRPRQTVAGSGRDGGGGEGSGKFVLSRDRVQAIKDAGAWEDPKKRARMIERYRAYDRENAQQRSA